MITDLYRKILAIVTNKLVIKIIFIYSVFIGVYVKIVIKPAIIVTIKEEVNTTCKLFVLSI